MSTNRTECHDLIDGLPDDQVAAVLAEVRRRAIPHAPRTTEPFAWIGMVKEAKNRRTGNAEHIDELMGQGFGRD